MQNQAPEENNPTGLFTVFCAISTILASGLGIAWYLVMWRLHSPAPFADDLDSCINFMSDWVETGSWQLLFSIHNESPQLLLRSLVLLSYLITNTVSFSFLAACSISSPVIFSLLTGWYLRYKLKLPLTTLGLFALPCLLFTAQPGSWGSYLWVTSGLTHGIMPLLMLAMVFAFECRYFLLSIAICLAGLFAGGAGVFFPLILSGLFIYFYGRNYRSALIALPVVIISAGIFILLQNQLLAGNLRDFLGADGNLIGTIQYIMAFIGNVFVFPEPAMAIISGLIVVMLFYFIRLDATPAIYAVCLLALLSATSSAILRYPSGGLSHALLSRYEVYSTTFWAALYAAFLIQLPRWRKLIWATALVLAAYISINNYDYLPQKVATRQLVLNRDFVFARFDPEIIVAHYPPRSAVDRILNRAGSHNVFNLDQSGFFNQYLERDVGLPVKSAAVLYNTDLLQEDDSYFVIRGSGVIKADEVISPERICLLAASTRDTNQNFRLCLPKQNRPGIIAGIEGNPINAAAIKNSGFSLLVPKQLLDPGDYKIGLMVAGKKNWHLVWLPKILERRRVALQPRPAGETPALQ